MINIWSVKCTMNFFFLKIIWLFAKYTKKNICRDFSVPCLMDHSDFRLQTHRRWSLLLKKKLYPKHKFNFFGNDVTFDPLVVVTLRYFCQKFMVTIIKFREKNQQHSLKDKTFICKFVCVCVFFCTENWIPFHLDYFNSCNIN